MQRRDFLKIVAGAGIAVGGGILAYDYMSGTSTETNKTRNGKNINVVLISIDCLNQRQFDEAIKGNVVPFLQSFKTDSLTFTKCHAHAPWTTPSHMCMLTGLYPNQHGRDIPYLLMLDQAVNYDRVPIFISIADLLASYGYETLAITGNGSISAKYGLDKGFQQYLESTKDESNSDIVRSMKHFNQWITSRDKNKPFFLFFHTYDFHGPVALYNASIDIKTNFDNCLNYIDEYLGRIFTLLKEHGYYDSSLILLTGDHGSAMIETQDKCCFHGAGHYEENLKVPLIVKLSDSSRTGTNEALSRHIDLFPTIVNSLGINQKAYPGLGISLLNRFKVGAANEVPEISFSTADAYWQYRYAFTTEKYKYIYTPRNLINKLLPFIEEEHNRLKCKNGNPCCTRFSEELYDIESDPFEHSDLLRKKDVNSKIGELLNAFRKKMFYYLNMPVAYKTAILTEVDLTRGLRGVFDTKKQKEHLKALKQLGYIQ